MNSRIEVRALAVAAVAVFVVACASDTPIPSSPTAPTAALQPVESPPQQASSLSPEYCLVNTPFEPDDDALATASPQARQELAKLRATVAHMRDGAGAIASGYFPNPLWGCIQGAGDRGGLGRNFTNIPCAFDSVLDPSKPEIVVMEGQEDRSTKLVSVLHTIGAGPGHTPIRAESFSGPPYPSPRPKLYGRYFDGPFVQPGVGSVFWALRVHHHVESGVTAVYDRHSYDSEKRAALDFWGRHVEAIVNGKRTSKVLPFKARA